MFTGIVEELGTVTAFEPRHGGARLTIQCSVVLGDLHPGGSIAVNGVCLTALNPSATSFSADLAPETLSRTNLRNLTVGASVNLERPLTPAMRLSGHIVQGHVDATAPIASLDELGDGNWWLRVQLPQELIRYVVHKGSITLDGISLTVAAIEGGTLSVTIIPHTFSNTTLGSAEAGSLVNVEVDILARHVEKLLTGIPGAPASRL